MSRKRSRCSSSALLALAAVALASGCCQAAAAAAAAAGAGAAGAFVSSCSGNGAAGALVSRSARTARAPRTRRPGEGKVSNAGGAMGRAWQVLAGGHSQAGGAGHVVHPLAWLLCFEAVVAWVAQMDYSPLCFVPLVLQYSTCGLEISAHLMLHALYWLCFLVRPG